MPQLSPIAQRIWDMKYRLKDASGAAVDRTVEDSWRRIASALARPEDRSWRRLGGLGGAVL